MVLTKSISEDFGASTEVKKYLVLPGDNLHRILRKFGIKNGGKPEFLKAFRQLNPQVRNLDFLVSGQVLLIPVGSGATAPGKSPGGGETPAPATTPLPEHPLIEPPEETAPGPLLAEVFTRLGEKIQSQGTLYFPRKKGTGALSLDGNRYPLVTLAGGAVLVLDTEGTIPDAVSELIESTWPGYRVIRLEQDTTPEQALDMVLRKGFFYSVARKKNLVLGGDAQVSLSCDWLVEKTPDSILNGSLYAVNYARYPREVIPQVIRDYAARYNIEVVNLPAGSEQKTEIPRAPVVVEHLPGADRAALLDGLLRRLGMVARANEEIRLYDKDAGGVGLTFRADRLVETPAGQLAISFREIPATMESILHERGFKLLVLPATTPPPEQTVTAALSALGVRYFGPDLEFFQAGEGGADKFIITIPGVFIRHRGASLLFTGKVPEEHLLSYLADRGVILIVY